ncbi:MAG TPA: hypothetical protein VFQ27_10290 [Xanthobacteraceae bacterium]|nr:hypothetical protein [Xanthobacteraceae bacterium]
MTKTLTALAAAATLAVVAVGAPTEAQARWRHGGGAVAAGIITGLAAGAIIGSAAAGPRYYYEPAPVYVAPPPAYCLERQWVWSPRRGDYVLRNVRVPC